MQKTTLILISYRYLASIKPKIKPTFYHNGQYYVYIHLAGNLLPTCPKSVLSWYSKYLASNVCYIAFIFVLQIPFFDYMKNPSSFHLTSVLVLLWSKSCPNTVHYTSVDSIMIKIRLFSYKQYKCVASAIAKIIFILLIYAFTFCQTYICIVSIIALIVFVLIQLSNLILIMIFTNNETHKCVITFFFKSHAREVRSKKN